MAKKRRRGRRLFVPRIDGQTLSGALAAFKVNRTVLPNVLDQECWAISMDCVYTLATFTASQGPIMIGVSHSDYSSIEVEEFLEAAASWTKANKIQQEAARRKIRVIGTFLVDADGTAQINDGRPIRTKLGFALESGMTLAFWIYNMSDSDLTSGGILNVTGKAYLKPQ